MDTLKLLIDQEIYRIMGDSFLPSLTACSTDPDANVRDSAVFIIGTRWIEGDVPVYQNVIDSLLLFSKDPNRKIRHSAAIDGLTKIEHCDDAIIHRLVEMALHDRSPTLYRSISRTLSKYEESTTRTLNTYINGDDPYLKKCALDIFNDMRGTDNKSVTTETSYLPSIRFF